MKLSDIDLTRITTLEKAWNVISQLLQVIQTQQETLALLEAEIAKLKGQPKKPHAPSSQKNNSSISISSLLKEPSNKKQNWHKSKKKETLPIDQHIQLPSQEICSCGSSDLITIHAMIKIVQGMIIRRNNIAYHGSEQKCRNCGKKYKPDFPKDTNGFSFDMTIQSLVSFLKFDGRFTHPLLHRFLTGFGIHISYGEITEIIRRNSKKLKPALLH